MCTPPICDTGIALKVRQPLAPRRDLPGRKALERQVLLGIAQGQVKRDEVLAGKASAVDRAKAARNSRSCRLAPVHRRHRKIGQLIVVPIVADAGRELGILT